jgi:hypothetical protein
MKMIIESGINPNCSEATMRIKLDGQDQKKIDGLIEKLNLELNNNYDITSSKQSNWDDEATTKEFEFSEAYVSVNDIFGIRVLEISGDAPYNMGDDMEKLVRRYLPKAKIEWNEG